MNSTAKLTAFQRFVLLALAELDAADETPAFDYDVKRRCERRLERVDEPFGSVTRCSVIRALGALESAEIVEERPPGTDEVRGMGRPTYALAVPPEDVQEAVERDGPPEPMAAE